MAANAECAETVGTYMSDGQNSLHLVMDAKLGVLLFNVFLSLYKALWSTCDCVKLGVSVYNVSSSLQPSITVVSEHPPLPINVYLFWHMPN